jgi:hypothetical protein
MALTDIDAANRSLALLGADPISSFEDGTTESDFCNQLYEGLAQSMLTEKPWRFAMKQAELDRLVAAPVGRWEAAYQLPSDVLRLMAVTVNDSPIHYDRYDDMVYCNATSSDTLVADYIYRADESLWLPYFTQAFVYMFAGLLGGALARDAALVEKYTDMGEKALMKAANVESQSQTTRRLHVSRFLGARGNIRNGGFRDDGY